MKIVRWLAGLAAAASLLGAMPVTAQPYPNKPIRLVVPFGAGSGSDILARIIAEPLSQALGQSIIVEKMKSLTTPQACWLIVDFEARRWWHGLLAKAMYFFFSLTTGLQTKQLPRWREALLEAGLYPTFQQTYWWDFIQASVWKLKP